MRLLAAGTAGDLLRVVWSSVLATVAVSILFSGAVVGLIRASELRRTHRRPAAAVYTAAALAALIVCLAAVVYGIILVGRKS